MARILWRRAIAMVCARFELSHKWKLQLAIYFAIANNDLEDAITFRFMANGIVLVNFV